MAIIHECPTQNRALANSLYLSLTFFIRAVATLAVGALSDWLSLPAAFAIGEGSEFRSPMGQAVIGGLITSTLLTLFVVPVVYSIIDDFSWRRMFGFVLRLATFRKNYI